MGFFTIFIISNLIIPKEEIYDIRTDRLIRLLDFFKSGAIQVSDFQRIMKDGENPYQTTMTSNMKTTLGGGLATTSTFNWKFSAVQQAGLSMSK